MAKVATDFMKRHKWTSETPSSELAKYTKEINKSLKDDRKVRFNAKTHIRQLGLIKEQVEDLIPIRPTGKHEKGRDIVDKIAQEIVNNDFPLEKIKEISNDLAGYAPNPVAGSSRLTLLQKKLRDHEADHSKKKTRCGINPIIVDPIRAKKLLTWIQNAISEKIHFLTKKNRSGIVNVNPINTTIAEHGITSRKLR
ncbi:2008_t:CDS:2, partial [Rhizophagus irregularis]